MSAVVAHGATREQLSKESHLVVGEASALGGVKTEVLEFLWAVAEPENIGGPAPADDIEERHVLGQPDGVVKCHDDDQAQRQPLGAGGDGRAENQRHGQIPVLGTMVFAQHRRDTAVPFGPRRHVDCCRIQARGRSAESRRPHVESQGEHRFTHHPKVCFI